MSSAPAPPDVVHDPTDAPLECRVLTGQLKVVVGPGFSGGRALPPESVQLTEAVATG